MDLGMDAGWSGKLSVDEDAGMGESDRRRRRLTKSTVSMGPPPLEEWSEDMANRRASASERKMFDEADEEDESVDDELNDDEGEASDAAPLTPYEAPSAAVGGNELGWCVEREGRG